MHIQARQNYIDVGTQTVLVKRAKDQLGKGETCSGDAALNRGHIKVQ
jgi:hypothetical protein